MESFENKYVILPKRGYKSIEMRDLNPKRSGDSQISTYAVDVIGGSVSFNIIDSISRDGPKVVSMSSFEARELRNGSSLFRVLPIIKYRPARRGIRYSSRKALSNYSGKPIQAHVFVKEEGTDKPLNDVDVIAIVDRSSGAGARRRTGLNGQLTLTLPDDVLIKQLFVYPPPGYWGKYIEDYELENNGVIYLKKVQPKFPDFLRQFYKTPRKGSGKGIRVGVIDTGVDPNHNELNLHLAKNCIHGEKKTNLVPTDGHATHVAGIIAAKNYGIAPEVELCSYKVFPHHGLATNADIARAIDTAADDQCDLVNLSLGGGKADELLNEAIGYAFEKGTVCIVASGNSQRSPVAYPAWFKRSIAVSALGKVGTFPDESLEVADISNPRSTLDKDIFFAKFSNIGREIDICAPGVGIVSTWAGGGIAVESGTSMACPIVTGVAAALMSANNEMRSAERNVWKAIKVVELIYNSCRSLGMPQIYEGFGQPVY
jgi:subtilisin